MAYGLSDIYALGFDPLLNRNGESSALSIPALGNYNSGIQDTLDVSTAPQTLFSGGIGENLTLVSGQANAANINIGTGSNVAGINSAAAASDIAFWAGASHLDRGTAPFTVTAAGAMTATGASISGTISAASGYFGSASNGVQISSGGLLVIGTGYIGTGVSPNERAVLLKSLEGLGHGFGVYNSSGDRLFSVSSNSSPVVVIDTRTAGGTGGGIAVNDTNESNTANVVSITNKGLNFGLIVTTSGSAARTSTYAGIKIANGSSSGDALRITTTNNNANVLRIDKSSATAVHDSRISNEGYLEFPAYYHCSDFDEYISGDTVLASSVIAKSFWVGGGTAGTQTLITGTNQDTNSYINLSTTSTANRTSTLTFGRFLKQAQVCVEFRFRVSNITNTKIQFGLFADATHYALFTFDTAVSSTLIYFATNDGFSSASISTGATMDADAWHTLRLQLYTSNAYNLFLDDAAVTAGSQFTNIGPSKPYVYIDNKAASEEKIAYLDYIKMWTGRDNTSDVS